MKEDGIIFKIKGIFKIIRMELGATVKNPVVGRLTKTEDG